MGGNHNELCDGGGNHYPFTQTDPFGPRSELIIHYSGLTGCSKTDKTDPFDLPRIDDSLSDSIWIALIREP